MLRPKIACIALFIGTHAEDASTTATSAALWHVRRTSRDMSALPILGEQSGLMALQDAPRLVQLGALAGHVDAETAGRELGIVDDHRFDVGKAAQHEDADQSGQRAEEDGQLE